MASSSFATHSIKYFFTSILKLSFVMHCLIWPGKLFQFLAPTNENEYLPGLLSNPVALSLPRLDATVEKNSLNFSATVNLSKLIEPFTSSPIADDGVLLLLDGTHDDDDDDDDDVRDDNERA